MRLRRKGRLMGRWILRQLKDPENYEVSYKSFRMNDSVVNVSADGNISDGYFSLWVPLLWKLLIKRKIRSINLDSANDKLKIW